MARALRQALARVTRWPRHSALVVAMLALGVGGSTAVFGLLDALVFAPLPFDEPERIVAIDQAAPELGLASVPIDYADFDAWRRAAPSFEAMALVKGRAFNLAMGGSVERVDALGVTHDLARVLRVRPACGRMFTPEEDSPGGRRVAILGYALWRRLLPAGDDALGHTLRLDGEAYEIVGVLPEGLRLPDAADLWVPLAADPAAVGSYRYSGLGRLRPGATLEAARRDLDAAMAPLREQHPLKRSITPLVTPLREQYVGRAASTAWALTAAVGALLVVACFNVAALQLALGVGRAREMSIRAALGAARRRLVRQLLGESLILAVVGGGLGVLLGVYGLRALGALAADQLPFWVSFTPRAGALALCLCGGVLTTLLTGLVPALASTRAGAAEVLRSGTAGLVGAGAPRRTLAGLVVGEVALVQTLLFASGLAAVSLWELRRVDPGYRPRNALSFSLALPAASYPEPERRLAFYRDLRRELAALPGVVSAAASTNLPLQGFDGWFFEAEGESPRRSDDPRRPVVLSRQSTDGYLATMGIRLRAGRDLGPRATATGGADEVVVNERFARLYWPRGNAVGRRIRAGEDAPWLTVVGVAGDVRHRGVEEATAPGIYVPLGNDPPGRLSFVVRTAIAPDRLIPAVRDAVRRLDPELPLYDVMSLEQVLRGSLAVRRLGSALLGAFAAVGLLLATGGVFSVGSYLSGRRVPELGLRAALGATRGSLLRLLVRDGALPVTLGILLGVLARPVVTDLLSGLLTGAGARDPRILWGPPALLVLVALGACLLPALRGSAVEPMRVLRDE